MVAMTPEWFDQRLQTANCSELREVVEMALPAWCKHTKRGAASSLVHALDRMREKDSAGRERWQLLFNDWQSMLDMIGFDTGMEAMLRRAVAHGRGDEVLIELAEKVAALAEATREAGDAKGGRPKKELVHGTSLGTGNSSGRLTARIKRDRPDIADRMIAGEFRSVRAAALEAGIVKPPNAYRELCKWWRKADEEQRAEFEEYIAHWRRTQ